MAPEEHLRPTRSARSRADERRRAEAAGVVVPHSPFGPPVPGTAVGAESRIDMATAYRMLEVDFEQAFILHNEYKDSERDLYKLALKILAAPFIVVGALLSAKLVNDADSVPSVLNLPYVWSSLFIAAVLNLVVVRAYVVTDRVQTESKHQVNRLRSLYLHALRDTFPPGWQPVWGSTNPYLESRRKLRAATLTPLILGGVNGLYVGFAVHQAARFWNWDSWRLPLGILAGLSFFALQLELTWRVLRALRRRAKR